MKTQLNGLIVSNYKQDTSLVFIDMSIYNSMLPIDEPSLTVITPYNKNPISLHYIAKGNTLITTISLNQSSSIEQIPCGLYKFKQSICPHDKLFYNFWYVHLGNIKQKIAKLYCENKLEDAIKLSEKVDAVEALTFCISEESERKILGILETLDCSTDKCTSDLPMNKIISIPSSCGCKKTSCTTCNKR
jgi:hypothetical protein